MNKSKKTLRILAVDHNEANLLVLHHYLENSQVIFLSARSGSEALAILEKNTVNLILMDVEMEGLDGIATTHIIRSKEKEKVIIRVPIIGLSAHGDSAMKITLLQEGFDDYISKPVSQASLLSCIERWLELSQDAIDINENKVEPSTETEIITNKALPLTSNNNTTIHKVIDIQTSLTHSNQNYALAKDMLTLLIGMIKKEKVSVRRHCQNKNWEALYQLNHKIYGGCAYCGVPELQASTQQLEMALQSHSAADITPTIEPLINNVEIAMDNIIQWEQEYDIDIVFGE